MKKGLGYLALAGCLLALSACSGKDNKQATEKKNSDVETPLRVWSSTMQPSTTVTSWKESPFHTGLEKQTGIKVDWEFPSEGSDVKQAFNLMIADTDLPDIINYGLKNDAQAYIKDGIIKDLTDILPKKAPNYWKYLQDNPDLAKAVKTDDGKYYGFGVFREKDIQGATYGPLIRVDWLEENNLEIPTNPNEWENALKVFKDKYGATLSFIPSTMNFAGFAGAFGAHGTFGLGYYMDGDKVKLTQEQPEWKEYMAWLNKLYSEGLIDPDTVTADDESLKTKAANDKLAATYYLGSRKDVYEKQSTQKGGHANWETIPNPDQNDGKPNAFTYTAGRVQGPVWAVNGNLSGARLDEALKWLDFAFSKEGMEYWNFGEKGVTWEEKDGKPRYTDEIVKNPQGVLEARLLYTGTRNSGLGVQLIESLARTTDGFKKEESAGYDWTGDEAAIAANYPADVTFTSDESKEMASLANSIDGYCTENAMKFMLGERSLDEWPDFVKELKDLNVDRLTEIRQAAYDRYSKR